MSKKGLECFHLSMPSLHNLQHVLDQPVLCSMLIAPPIGLTSLVPSPEGGEGPSFHWLWIIKHMRNSGNQALYPPSLGPGINLRPDWQFLCCTCVYFLCDILWPEGQYDSHVHATAPCSAYALAHTCPSMSCIPLVLLWLYSNCCSIGMYCGTGCNYRVNYRFKNYCVNVYLNWLL